MIKRFCNLLQKRQQQKVEKASRKSRKRKTTSYKEEDISHSSDLDSSTDEEAEVLDLTFLSAGRSGWCLLGSTFLSLMTTCD